MNGEPEVKKVKRDRSLRTEEDRAPTAGQKKGNGLQGDGAPLAEMTDRHAGIVYWLSWSILEDSREAEEVLYKTFLKAHSYMVSSGHGSVSFFWLARTALNEALETLRFRDTEKWEAFGQAVESADASNPMEVVDWAENAEQRYSAEELAKIVIEAVRTLSPASRVVFLLHDVTKLSSKDISQLLDMSLADVKQRTLRGRMQLRERLDPYFRQLAGGPA